MIGNYCGVLSHEFRSFENDVLLVQRIEEFLDLYDILSCGRVCKTFSFAINQDNRIWAQLSVKEGIPLVANPYCNRNRKEDLLTLHQMTLGTARIDPTLGEVIGPIPCIHETVFKILGTPDPFQEGKLIKETYMLVVFPSHIKRTAGFQTPLDLDSQGNLIKVFADQIQHGKELVISLTPKNIRVLTYYPLSSYPREKDENIVVFNKVGFNEADNNPIFDHCSNISDKTRVYLMRRCVIGKNLPYAEQEELVKKFGFDVTPTCVRMLSNAVEILTSGTCPDNFSSFQTSQAESIFACGPEPVVCVNGENGHPAIGGFIRGKGLYPYYCEDNDAQKFLGVAPCTRADDPFVGKDADVPQVDNADIFYVGD